MKISVVIPVYNEEGNVESLCRKIFALKDKINLFEVIVVDDCSNDNTLEKLTSIAKRNSLLTIIRLQQNFGQTAAMSAGIDHASGEVIVTLDGDNQNDPADIPLLVQRIESGFDIVSGWRKERWKGAFFSRKLPSIVANKIISRLGNVPIYDFGCSLKAYRADMIKPLRLYGDMHRYLPLYVCWNGGKLEEVEVSYHERVSGVSKYGFGRVFKVLYDLLALRYYGKYFNHPMYFFGKIGFSSSLLGTLCGAVALYQRFEMGIPGLNLLPLLLLTVFLIFVGVQFLVLGIIAELIMRTYYESQNKKTYIVKEVLHFKEEAEPEGGKLHEKT